MAAYEYKALDASGRERRGVLDGDSARQIRQLLREQGLLPVSVTEVSDAPARKRAFEFSFGNRIGDPGPRAADAPALDAGALRASRSRRRCSPSRSRARKPRVRSVVAGVRARVMEGRTLAEGLGAFPTVFPEIYRATVSAGEQSGHLDAVLERMADYTENRQVLQQKIRNAMIYPVLLTVICLGIVGAPARLRGAGGRARVRGRRPGAAAPDAHPDRELGLPARLVVAADRVAVAGASGASAAGCGIPRRAALRRLQAAPAADRPHHARQQRRALRPHLLDPDRERRAGARGAPDRGRGRHEHADAPAVQDAAVRVREGAPIARSLGASKLFPPMLVHLIASGETSGELESMLERAADNQERELDGVVNTAVGILGPAMILLMGGFVFVIVIALLLPIFQLNQLVR